MKKLVLVALLLSTEAFAQAQPATLQQRIETVIGALTIQNAELQTRVEQLTRQLEEAKQPAPKPEGKK